jgi:proteic killer suppression protein
MIKNIRHKGLRELNETGKSRYVHPDFAGKCLRILEHPAVAEKPEDMNIACFFFHGLQGNPKRYSVRVSRNWRITFGWDDGVTDIDLVDYH